MANNGLVWNVYVEHFNRQKIVPYNIFDHTDFLADIQKEIKRIPETQDDEEYIESVSSVLRSVMMYYFWSKCEWEIVLTSWPTNIRGFHDEKVDVYDQVRLNWDSFVDYVMAHLEDILKARIE